MIKLPKFGTVERIAEEKIMYEAEANQIFESMHVKSKKNRTAQ